MVLATIERWFATYMDDGGWWQDNQPNGVRLHPLDYERLVDELQGQRRLGDRPAPFEAIYLNVRSGQVEVRRDINVAEGHVAFIHEWEHAVIG